MQKIEMEPIGRVVSTVGADRDDHWGGVIAEIQLDRTRFDETSLAGLEDFSHVEVLFSLDRVEKIEMGGRHPRNNPQWPKVGIFAQRGRSRPNRIAATICKIAGVAGLTLKVNGLDAFDGSPVLDIKPVMAEFLPDKKELRQPQWSRELMKDYF